MANRKRAQKSLVDLTRESSNVVRALRSNRGLNHELKITFQHIASEKSLAEVSWRNKERLIRRHAVNVLGPYQQVIMRIKTAQRHEMLNGLAQQQQQSNSNRNNNLAQINGTVLPAISYGPGRRETTAMSPSRSKGRLADSSSPSDSFQRALTLPIEAESPSKEVAIIPNRPQTSSNESKLRKKKTSVNVLEEKLDKFHLHLTKDSEKAALEDLENETDADEDSEHATLDTARLSRLRNNLVTSVAGARLHLSAKKRNQITSGSTFAAQWNALSAAMNYNKRNPTNRVLTHAITVTKNPMEPISRPSTMESQRTRPPVFRQQTFDE